MTKRIQTSLPGPCMSRKLIAAVAIFLLGSCFKDELVSSDGNPGKASIYSENGHFFARVIFGQLAQGPPGHVHGGAIAAVLDEAMGAVAWMNDFTAMTVNLEVQYYKSVKLETVAYVEAWVDRSEEKKVYVKGILVSEDESLYAEANSLFIRQSKEQFQSMGDIPDYLFQRYTPKKSD